MNIQTVVDREKLKARPDPYWVRISKGCYLGYRKTSAGSVGSWVARSQIDDEKRQFMALGDFATTAGAKRYDAALKDATSWFTHLGKGGLNQSITIAEVCTRYVDSLKASKPAAAADARRRFDSYVLNNQRLAKTDIQKLTQDHVTSWRKALQATPCKAGPNRGGQRSDSSLNRDITPFRSALNAAFHAGLVTSPFAWEKPLVPVTDADGTREVYLDLDQRRALARCAQPDLAALIQAMSLVPVRPGAMSRLTVADLDRRLNTLRIGRDKTGARKIALPADTANFFLNLATNKLPTAHLLTREGGKAWDKDSWKKPFKAAALAAGLPPGVTLYALRHSTITDLVHNGLDLLTVSQVSGTSLRMIEKHYGHLVSAQSRKALSMLSI